MDSWSLKEIIVNLSSINFGYDFAMIMNKKETELSINDHWEIFAEGDGNVESSFSFIYNVYSSELYSYGISLGYSEEMCKDALHDTFYSLYLSRIKLKRVENKASYLFRSFKNRLFDNVRRTTNVRIDSENMNILDFSINTTALDLIIDEETTRRLIVLINDLLNSLTSHQKEAVYLRYMQNMNYDEIASILNITNASARKLVYRSLEHLRKKISNINIKDLLPLILVMLKLQWNAN
ncbi:hypothetical protein MASR2M117_14590 [Paludibacter sp.]